MMTMKNSKASMRLCHDVDVSLPLLTAYLHQKLNDSDIPNRYFSGGVNFCALRPMRSVPFKMVCLLGMNDAAFPRREHPIEFDKMTQDWLPGDPVNAEQDRYLMLETLLCCRETLYISYVARNIRDDRECQASVLVSELMDELQHKYGESTLQELIHEHPMQAFSKLNFSPKHASDSASYDRYWCMLANQLHQASIIGEPVERCWASSPIIHHERKQTTLSLEHLIRFAKHPVKYFVNHRLNLYLQAQDDYSDDEPFQLNHLEEWSIKNRMLHAELFAQGIEDERFRAEGLLPHGIAGDVQLESETRAIQTVLTELKDYSHQEKQMQWVEVDVHLKDGESITLAGQVRDYIPNLGLLHATPSKLKGKYLLDCWLEHLALCSAGLLGDKECSRLQCSNQAFTFAYMEKEPANMLLSHYIEGYLQGTQYPLPIFEGASYAHVFGKEKDVILAWKGKSFQNIPGDCDDAYVQLAMRDVDANPIVSDDFQDWAETWYQPIQEYGEEA